MIRFIMNWEIQSQILTQFIIIKFHTSYKANLKPNLIAINQLY